MRQEPDISGTADALSLSELLARYVSGQAARFEEGTPVPDLGGEVCLHDATGATQAIDPRLAWDEALAWHAGRRGAAADLWKTRGDASHVPTLFNLGLAALFQGRPSEARPSLTKAVAQLPDDNSWHHLGRLYLALAEMRGA